MSPGSQSAAAAAAAAEEAAAAAELLLKEAADGEKDDMGRRARPPAPGLSRWLKPSALVAVSAAVAFLLYGYDTGIIAGAMLFIVPQYGLEGKPALQGAIVSAALVGALPGTMAAGPASDYLGRRRFLLLSALLFGAGGVAMAAAPGVWMLIAGRGLVGLAVGAAAPTVPVFIAECSPAQVRGRLATLPQLGMSAGILLSYATALLVSLTHSPQWRLMLGLSIVPAVVFGALVWGVPESPRWLSLQGRHQEASRALARLHLSANELADVQKPSSPPGAAEARGADRSVPRAADEATQEGTAGGSAGTNNEQHALVGEEEKERGDASGRGARRAGQRWWASLQELRKEGPRRALMIGLGLQAFQQLCGINAVVFYTPQILKLAGAQDLIALNDKSASILATIASYSLKVPVILLSMRLVDLVGRRRLLLYSIPFMALALVVLAASFLGLPLGAARAALAMACVALYGCSFVVALGPTPNILCSEMFETHIRGLAMGICVGVNFACSVAVSQTFPMLVEAIGMPALLFSFAAVSVGAWVFVLLALPETAGLSLEVTPHLLDSEWKTSKR